MNRGQEKGSGQPAMNRSKEGRMSMSPEVPGLPTYRGAADEVRVHHQSEGGETDRPEDSA